MDRQPDKIPCPTKRNQHPTVCHTNGFHLQSVVSASVPNALSTRACLCTVGARSNREVGLHRSFDRHGCISAGLEYKGGIRRDVMVGWEEDYQVDSGWTFSKSRQGHISDTSQGTCRQQRAWLIGRSTLPRGLLCLERHRVWLGDGKV